MRRIMVLAIVASVVGSAAYLRGAQRGHELPANRHEEVTITRMFTGPDGLTHFEETNLPFGAPMEKTTGISFRRTRGPQKSGGSAAEGFTFHTAPHRRYVVTLSGKAEIEASGGGRFIADANHILLAEDLTGKGHRYTVRPLGNEDWVNMFVEIDQPRQQTQTR
jgi:hypothetical protein